MDQDLSRLYPEDGSYFQTPTCQAMLRRILLMWCLQHPEYGYRQGKKLLSHVEETSSQVVARNLVGFLLSTNFMGLKSSRAVNLCTRLSW